MQIDLDELERLAEAATPGPWMRLFGERTVYDRMEDGCRGISVVRSDNSPPTSLQAANLDFIAAANPATVLELVRRLREAEHDLQVTETQCLDGIQAQNELHEEIEQLRKDADRYRWLRHNSGFSIAERLFGEQSMSSFIDAELDALIDGELAQEAKSGE